jgi:hypothetical protein
MPQDANQGVTKLLNCWNECWTDGASCNLTDPLCTNASPGGKPTANEVGYASYLLRGSPPVLSFDGTLVPRWTLNDTQ